MSVTPSPIENAMRGTKRMAAESVVISSDPWIAFRSQTASVQAIWIGALACISAIYAPTFVRLAKVWYENPDYSHGFLVIPASIYFARIAWKRFGMGQPVAKGSSTSEVATGIIEITLGFLLHLAGLAFDVSIIDVLSLICVLRGTILLVGGTTYYRAFAFPVLFLIFLSPLPPAVHQWLALFMQQAVAMVSTLVLDLFGVPIYREGYLMHVPGYTMEVGAACSGLRSMTAILALAVAIGFLMNRSTWYCWTLGLLAIPIAGVANCLRVILTGVIMINLGREYADGVYHQLEGMVLEAVAATILMAVAFALAKFDPKQPETIST